MLDGHIKNLLIDFGGVLIDLDRRRCLEHFRRLGMPDVENLLHDCHQEGFFQLHEKGLISDAGFRERIRQAIGRPVTDEAIDEAWNSFLDGMLRKHYTVCLLSNTNAIHWDYACTHDFAQGGRRVEDYFDRIYLSYQLKMIKPDAEIFQAVLADAGLTPEETLFIDDAEANCRTARSLGIHTYTPQAHEDWRHLFQ